MTVGLSHDTTRDETQSFPDNDQSSPKDSRRPSPSTLASGDQPKVCQIDGCAKKHLARGLCTAHYRQARRGTLGEENGYTVGWDRRKAAGAQERILISYAELCIERDPEGFLSWLAVQEQVLAAVARVAENLK